MPDQAVMNSVKIAGVHNWSTLYNYINIQTFLEFTNFYYKFIYSFLDIVCPLFDVASNNTI